jgi:uncharacterized membrane protein (GlpM family)
MPHGGLRLVRSDPVKELVLRLLMGGVAVSLFAAVAELFKPKTFSGIFVSAPAVALVSAALVFSQRGDSIVRAQALGMICGSCGFVAYFRGLAKPPGLGVRAALRVRR